MVETDDLVDTDVPALPVRSQDKVLSLHVPDKRMKMCRRLGGIFPLSTTLTFRSSFLYLRIALSLFRNTHIEIK